MNSDAENIEGEQTTSAASASTDPLTTEPAKTPTTPPPPPPFFVTKLNYGTLHKYQVESIIMETTFEECQQIALKKKGKWQIRQTTCW